MVCGNHWKSTFPSMTAHEPLIFKSSSLIFFGMVLNIWKWFESIDPQDRWTLNTTSSWVCRSGNLFQQSRFSCSISICCCLFKLYSPRFAWGGRPHRRLFWPTQTYIQKIRQKHCFFQCFYNVFRGKHRNLRGFRHKVGPKQWFLQCFQGSGIKKSSMPWSPQTLENTAIYTVFFNFSICQCRWPTQTYIQKIVQKHCFLQCFLHLFRQKRRNLHVFRLKVGPKHWFLQCFQCSGIQKPFKISLFTVFFHFCPFFPCRKPTKMTQNSVSIPS